MVCLKKKSNQINTHSSLFVLACQCNGHSVCVNGSVCEQCKNLTTGSQCQICLPGYYGDPTNGGKCQGEIFLFLFMFTSMSVCVCKSESMALEGIDFTPRKEDFVLICSLFQACMIFCHPWNTKDIFSLISRCCFPFKESGL